MVSPSVTLVTGTRTTLGTTLTEGESDSIGGDGVVPDAGGLVHAVSNARAMAAGRRRMPQPIREERQRWLGGDGAVFERRGKHDRGAGLHAGLLPDPADEVLEVGRGSRSDLE